MSMSILKNGKSANWRIDLMNDAIEYEADGKVWQQCGPGEPLAIIHQCRNMGEPFNSSRHRAALAMWNEIEDMTQPKTKDQKAHAIEKLRKVWSDAD